MKAFTVYGPFKVPEEPKKNGKMVAKDLDAFWDDVVGDLRKERGVYVFAVRASRGFTPVYVGKTTRSFEDEAFTKRHRADYYNPALIDYKRGSPVLFLVVHPREKGKLNASAIDAVETFLIDVASIKNGELANISKRRVHKWRIKGAVRASQGEGTSTAVKKFKRAVGL